MNGVLYVVVCMPQRASQCVPTGYHRVFACASIKDHRRVIRDLPRSLMGADNDRNNALVPQPNLLECSAAAWPHLTSLYQLSLLALAILLPTSAELCAKEYAKLTKLTRTARESQKG